MDFLHLLDQKSSSLSFFLFNLEENDSYYVFENLPEIRLFNSDKEPIKYDGKIDFEEMNIFVENVFKNEDL